jgi:hypothetical protein
VFLVDARIAAGRGDASGGRSAMAAFDRRTAVAAVDRRTAVAVAVDGVVAAVTQPAYPPHRSFASIVFAGSGAWLTEPRSVIDGSRLAEQAAVLGARQARGLPPVPTATGCVPPLCGLVGALARWFITVNTDGLPVNVVILAALNTTALNTTALNTTTGAVQWLDDACRAVQDDPRIALGIAWVGNQAQAPAPAVPTAAPVRYTTHPAGLLPAWLDVLTAIDHNAQTHLALG